LLSPGDSDFFESEPNSDSNSDADSPADSDARPISLLLDGASEGPVGVIPRFVGHTHAPMDHTHDDLHAGARVVSQLLARHLRVSAAAEPA